MFKERIKNVGYAIAPTLLQIGLTKEHWLKPEGKTAFRKQVKKIQQGEESPPSEWIDALKGFEINPPSGLENLKDLAGKSFIIIGNHPKSGPIRGGVGHLIITSRYVKDLTNQEVSWVLGSGFSIMSLYRSDIENSADVILIDYKKKDTGKKIFKKLDTNKSEEQKGKPVGLYTEGKTSRRLKKADFRSGRIILHVAEKNIPIVCAGTWYEKKDQRFNLSFGKPINPNKIIELGHSSNDKRTSGQTVVDYVMKNHLAPLLPQDLRGYYEDRCS